MHGIVGAALAQQLAVVRFEQSPPDELSSDNVATTQAASTDRLRWNETAFNIFDSSWDHQAIAWD